MRKLEFRAYSVDYELYRYQSDIDSTDEFSFSFSDDGIELLVLSESWSSGSGEWVDSEYWKVNKSAVIEQFTGVLDKDGTKIFEGDKVESYHFTDTKGKHHFINHIVTWSDKFNGWFMRGEYDTTGEDGSIQLWVYMRTNKHSAKVVGNIHQ